jgi:ComF family protein
MAPLWRLRLSTASLGPMDAEADTVPYRRGMGARLLAPGAALVRAGADIALPPQCLSCDRPTAAHGSLCASCWSRMRLIEKPYCARLGVPFAYAMGEGALSPDVISDPPPFDRCRAVAVFDEVARKLVHGLKYRDRLELASWMAVWMSRAGADVIATADLIMPVPLHVRRLWWRRANQSALLAQAIAARCDVRFAPLILRRNRATEQQVGLTPDQRDRNVRGAFHVPTEARSELAGRRVLLVDDVYTTGATVKAATRALLRAGAAAVDVLVFARVVRGAG